MDTLNHIVNKYNIDLSKKSPHELLIGRFKDLPRLFHELGFKEGAEIGVYRGAYSRYLLKYCPGLKLHMIDAWVPYSGYKDFEDNDLDTAMEAAAKNVEGFDAVLIKGWSTDKAVLDRFADESLDFVFIDGNHMYEYVVADIAAWSKKVRKGGIVFGHDFDDYTNHPRRWEEMTVIPAVEGWMRAHKIAPWFITTKNSNKCWLYVK
jgi:hypothetical protein